MKVYNTQHSVFQSVKIWKSQKALDKIMWGRTNKNSKMQWAESVILVVLLIYIFLDFLLSERKDLRARLAFGLMESVWYVYVSSETVSVVHSPSDNLMSSFFISYIIWTLHFLISIYYIHYFYSTIETMENIIFRVLLLNLSMKVLLSLRIALEKWGVLHNITI